MATRTYQHLDSDELHCTRCGEIKPKAAFVLRTSGRPHSWCRACKRAYDRETIAAKRRTTTKKQG